MSGRRARRWLVAGLAALAATALPAAPAGAATPEQIRDCVLRNAPRYANPENALVGQYANLEAACRAGIDGDEEAQVQIVPEGDGGSGTQAPARAGGDAPVSSGGGTSGSPGGGSGGAGADTSGASPASPGGGDTPAVSGSTTTAPAGRGEPGRAPGGAEPVTSAVELVQAADAGEAGGPVGADGTPGWLWALGGALGAVALGGAGLALRKRLR